MKKYYKFAVACIGLLVSGYITHGAGADEYIISSVYVKDAPKVDGVINDSCWGKCFEAGGFQILRANNLAQNQTISYICHDDKNIYIAFKCLESNMDNLKCSSTGKDEEMWADDHVEIMLLTGEESTEHYQIAVNPNGAVWDARCTEKETFAIKSLSVDKKWQSSAKVKSSRGKDYWSLEIAVPFTALGTSYSKNMLWKINLCRDEKVVPEMSTWSAMREDSFQERKAWASLVFRDGAFPVLNTLSIPVIQPGNNKIGFKITSPIKQGKWIIRTGITPFSLRRIKILSQKTEQMCFDININRPMPGASPGIYLLELRDGATGKIFYRYTNSPKGKYAEIYILDSANVLDKALYFAADCRAFQTFWLRHNLPGWNRGAKGKSGTVEKKTKLFFELPDPYRIVTSSFAARHKSAPVTKNGQKYTRYIFEKSRITNNDKSWFMLEKADRPRSGKQFAYIWLECGNLKQNPLKLEIKTIEIGKVRKPLTQIYTGIFDLHFSNLRRWLPEWQKQFRNLGFNTIDATTHLKGLSEEKYLREAKKNGYFLRNDYFFPFGFSKGETPHSRAWRDWTAKDSAARALSINGNFIKSVECSATPYYLLSPWYRGKLFQETMNGFIDSGFVEKSMADWYAYDTELYGSNYKLIDFSPKAISMFEKYVKTKFPRLEYISPKVFEKSPKKYPELHSCWNTFRENSVNNLFAAINQRIAARAKTKGIKNIIFSDWAHLHDCMDLTEWDLYKKPESCAVHIDNIKAEFFKKGKKFGFNPTFGQMGEGFGDMNVSRKDIKYLTLEAAAAGAKSIVYYSFSFIGDALKFKYIVEALNMISPVENIITNGIPADALLSSSNPKTRVRGMTCKGEAVVLVAEYKSKLPVEAIIGYKGDQPMEVIDLENGRRIAVLDRTQRKFKVIIDKERARLFHIKLVRKAH